MRRALVTIDPTEPQAAAAQPKTRVEAIALGVRTYFTGKPCKNGHIALRKAPSGTCTECSRVRLARNVGVHHGVVAANVAITSKAEDRRPARAKQIMAALISSVWLRVGTFYFVFLAAIQWGLYAATGVWSNPLSRLDWWFALLFVAGAALELWLRTASAKAIMAPIGERIAARFEPIRARVDKSRIWRELNNRIENSPSLTVTVLILMLAAMLAVMLAAMTLLIYISEGFNSRVFYGFPASCWPFFAVLAGFWAFWQICYHAGINPDRAYDRLLFAAAIGTIGFVAGMVWVAYPQFSFQSKQDAQRDFHKAILSAPAPCVAVQDKLSDLSACTVFSLRPGMTQSDVLGIVNGSGYFSREKPETCRPAEKCSHYVTFIKDGLYLRVEFKSDPKSATPEEQVFRIVFALDERANPYFDENQMMERFLKLIGPNGSRDTTDMGWIDIKNDLELRAYTYERKFWAVFERIADRPNRPGSGIPV